MKKVLIIQTASIGDVILATPLLEHLQMYDSSLKLDVLVKRGNEKLLIPHPFIHRVLVWDKSERKFQHLWQLMKVVRERKYDLIINVHRFASSGFLTAFSGATKKIGFAKNPFSPLFSKRVKHIFTEAIHEVDRNLNLVEEFYVAKKAKPRLYPSQQEAAKMSQFKTMRYITISPASLWFTKQFPQKKWVEFMKRIPDDIRIYLLGSASDREICRKIMEDSNNLNIMNLAGKLTFLESAELMKDAVMNFVNDSAPMHLCSAVNAPVTAIFCSTVPAYGFGPLSEKAFIIETEKILKCRPCGLHGKRKCPKKHFNCAQEINIQQLIEKLK